MRVRWVACFGDWIRRSSVKHSGLSKSLRAVHFPLWDGINQLSTARWECADVTLRFQHYESVTNLYTNAYSFREAHFSMPHTVAVNWAWSDATLSLWAGDDFMQYTGHCLLNYLSRVNAKVILSCYLQVSLGAQMDQPVLGVPIHSQ